MMFDSATRGILQMESEAYGVSVLGTTLRYIPCLGKCRLLVVAAIHGEEPDTTFLLSRSLRAFRSNFNSVAFVLCANPDGVTLGTRGNANGVDLNRNFATSNWSADKTPSRSVLEAPRDTFLSPGTAPASEPETRAIVSLVEKLDPESIVSMHSPIGCVDAPARTALVDRLSSLFSLPHVADIGYGTPGSFGTWCKEHKKECVTLELPRMSLEGLFDRFGVRFAEFLAAEDR